MADNKPASTYAKPHTMSGKPVSAELPAESVQRGASYLDEVDMSVGNVSKGKYKEMKTSGIEMRGGKAQTKGRMCRGPMA